MKVYMVNGALSGGLDWHPIPLLGNKDEDDIAVALSGLSLGHDSVYRDQSRRTIYGLGYTTAQGQKGGIDAWTWTAPAIKSYAVPTSFIDRNGSRRVFTPFQNVKGLLTASISIPLFTRTAAVINKISMAADYTLKSFKITKTTFDPKGNIAALIKTLKDKIATVQAEIDKITNQTYDFTWKEIFLSSDTRGYKGTNFFTALDSAFNDMSRYTSMDTISGWDSLNPGKVITAIKNNVNKILNFINAGTSVTKNVSKTSANFIKNINTVQKDAVTYTTNLFSQLPTEVANFITSLITNIEATASNISSEFKNIMSQVATGLKDLLNELITALKGDIVELVSNIKSYVSSLMNAISMDATDFYDYTSYMVTDLGSYVMSQAKVISENVVGNVKNMSTAVKGEIDYYIQLVYQRAQAYIDQSMVQVNAQFATMKKNMDQFSADTMGKITKVYNELKAAADALTGRIQGAEKWMTDAEKRFSAIEAKLSDLTAGATGEGFKIKWPFSGAAEFSQSPVRAAIRNKPQFGYYGHDWGEFAQQMAQPNKGRLRDSDFVNQAGLY